MPFWRAHPIRLAAVLGAFTGFLITLVTELRGVLHGSRNAVVPLFLPAFGSAHAGVMQTALILLIELVANVLVWALFFVVPVAIVVGIVRMFRSRRPR